MFYKKIIVNQFNQLKVIVSYIQLKLKLKDLFRKLMRIKIANNLKIKNNKFNNKIYNNNNRFNSLKN